MHFNSERVIDDDEYEALLERGADVGGNVLFVNNDGTPHPPEEQKRRYGELAGPVNSSRYLVDEDEYQRLVKTGEQPPSLPLFVTNDGKLLPPNEQMRRHEQLGVIKERLGRSKGDVI